MLNSLLKKLCKNNSMKIPRQARKDIVIVLPYEKQKILLIKEYRKL